MIGVYKDTYTYFWANSLSDNDQENGEIFLYINLTLATHNIRKPCFYHWSHIDEYIITNAFKKYNINLSCPVGRPNEDFISN